MLICLAVALLVGAMAIFRFWISGEDFGEAMASQKIGIVRVYGVIQDSEVYIDWIDRLEADDTVKGVLVRINSPGGAVAPSQEIYQALRRLNAKIPVVTSMATVAASGGYYVASATETIVANPGTLTGSIGVLAELPNFKQLLDKIGVSFDVVTSGELKAAGNPFSELTPKEKAYFEELVNNIHGQFVRDVAQGRNMPEEEVRKWADGRALTGEQAQAAGLVDVLGGMETAMDVLKAKIGVTGDVPVRDGPPPERVGLLRQLLSSMGFTPDMVNKQWRVVLE